MSSPPVHGPALPPGFQRQPPSATPTNARTSNDKLRGTFKCPKFLGDARHWKNWNKGFVRFLAIQVLDHVVAEGFKALTSVHQEDNKLVYYVLEDAVSGSPVATKYVRRAPLWDGHAAYNFLYDGYSFSGPAMATLLLSELSNFRFLADESVSELVLRLQEMFEDLEAVPGASSVVFGDTQKINYLLSIIRHERSMQPVYVQIQRACPHRPNLTLCGCDPAPQPRGKDLAAAISGSNRVYIRSANHPALGRCPRVPVGSPRSAGSSCQHQDNDDPWT
jgi:hypothetical protein